MAATFDNSKTLAVDTNNATESTSFSTSGSDRLLVVIVHGADPVSNISGITYNSTSLTASVSQASSGDSNVQLYYLPNPASGANTLEISFSGGFEGGFSILSYNGIKQTSPQDQTAPNSGDSANPSVSITPTSDNQLIVAGFTHDEYGSTNTPDDTETERTDFLAGSGIAVQGVSGDVIQTTAGAETLSWTNDDSEAQPWAMVAASFEQAPTAPSAPTLETADDTEITDTTPSLDFNATDPDGDDITYQIQIDTDSAFGTPDVDSVSDTDSGFSNQTTGADTDPFNSGDTIRFTVQGVDELTRGTYYWRVRGKDPSGTNTFGDWSATRAFHIYKADREASLASVSSVPTDSNHPYGDDAEALTDAQYTNIDSDNATRVSETGGSTTKPHLLQKVQITADTGFSVSFDGQVDKASAVGSSDYDADTDYDGGANVDAQHTFSHAVTTGGSNRLLVVQVMIQNDGTTVSSINYGGNGLTKAVEQSKAGDARTEIWYLIDPSTGSNTVEINLGAGNRIHAVATTLLDVDQTSPIDDTNSTTQSGVGDISLSLSVTNPDSIIVDALGDTNTTIDNYSTTETGQTAIADINNGFGQLQSSYRKVSSGSQSVGWSGATSTSNIAYTAVAFKPSSVDPSIKLDLWDFTNTQWVNQSEETSPTANTDFTLSADKSTGYEDFSDASGWVYARVYADYTPSVTLRVDKFVVSEAASTETRTHTTDSLKRTENTKTHSTDTLKRTENTQTHTTDSLNRVSATKTHTADSNRKKSFELTHTTDSNKRKEATLTHTTDTLKREEFALTHSTDTLKRIESTLTHSTDTLNRTENTLTHTTDSNQRKETTKTHTTDSNKKKSSEVTHTTDSNKKKAFEATHTTDSFLQESFFQTHTTDSNLKKAFEKSHSTDSLLRKEATLTHTTDSLNRTENTLTHTTDSNKRNVDTKSHTADSNKRKERTLTHTTDSLLKSSPTPTHSTDSLKRQEATQTHTTDSNKRKTNTQTHTTDASLLEQQQVTHSTDALKRTEVELTHTTDASKEANQIFHSTDALKGKKVDFNPDLIFLLDGRMARRVTGKFYEII